MTEATEQQTFTFAGKVYKAIPVLAGEPCCKNCDFRNDDDACSESPDCAGLNWQVINE